MRLARWQVVAAAVSFAACGGKGGGPATVAEIEVVRPPLSLAGAEVARAERVSAGAHVTVGQGGRAWVRHDASARVLLDGGARATVQAEGLLLEAGRTWIEAAPGSHFTIASEGASVDVAGARLEAAREGALLRLYVASGEVTVRVGARPSLVHAGETGEIDGAGVKVAAARLWDDWTGGLAWPDPGHAGDRPRGRGEIGARPPGSLGEARFPLAITRLEVRTRIEDDLAVTRVVESFFNPASETLEGLYRLRVPEGAILSRFAIDRDGRWADGFVKERETARAQYQAQVYQGSTRDPALLEWDAPGSYRARVYPIPAGATRRILVEYSEWLTPSADGTERTFRYPLAADADAPIIQELDVAVDATGSGAKSARAGLDARIDGLQIALERTDYRPRADLVVDLVSAARGKGDGEARAWRSPHRLIQRVAEALAHEDDYYLARPIPLPFEPRPAGSPRPPLDLVILVDVSAGTDATHLQLARTTAEALLRHLDDQDRVALAGADLDLHRPGPGQEPPRLVPATRVSIDQLLDALARQGTGGATDLDATLTQAAALLDPAAGPARRSAVVYIGDALPTVGQLDLKGLRERLDRLPAPLRLYGVAIGDDADLALLDGLSEGGGLAMRVGDRSAAAGAALRILSHASRRALHRVQVSLGAGVDRVYPRRPMTVVEGEAFPVLARVRSDVPSEIGLTALLDGKPWKAKLRATTTRLDDADDLRLRWASERLRQLLADGAGAEEVAELGTRQNLITPFTSYYVPSAEELSQLMVPSPGELAAGLALGAFGCAMRAEAPAPSPAQNSEAPAVYPKAMSNASQALAEAPPPAPTAPPPGAPMPASEAAARQQADLPADRAAPAKGADNREGLFGLRGARGPQGVTREGEGGGGTGETTIGLGAIGGLADKKRRAPMDEGPAPSASTRHASAMAAKAPRHDGGKDAVLGFLGGDDLEKQPQVGSLSAVFGTGDGENEDGDFSFHLDFTVHRPRHCSAASQLSLEDRADLWRERLSAHRGVDGALEIWQDASQRCELKMWADRRALLRAMLSSVGGASQMVALHARMAEDDAAEEFLRKAILGAARTPADLRTICDGLGLSEEVQWTLVEELVAKAKTAEARVTVLEQLEHRWPGDLRLKLKIIDALEAVGRKDDARRVADEVRAAPNADAQARTAVGELLVRLGDVPAARRAFSEIVEFAPTDPVARRRLGDLYRAHGWFDEAYRQYETLGALLPGDAAVFLLEAAAAAGANRVDEALRLEQRAADGTAPGAETGIARVATWWSSLRLALLREDARKKGDEAELSRLWGRARRANVLHDAQPLHAWLTWSHPEADCELWAQLPGGPMEPATEVAPEFGIASIGSHGPLIGPAVIEVRRPPQAASAGLRYGAELVVIFDEGQKTEHLSRTPLSFAPGGGAFRFRVDGGKMEVLQ